MPAAGPGALWRASGEYGLGSAIEAVMLKHSCQRNKQKGLGPEQLGMSRSYSTYL
jgi:hypothetical protein